MQIHHERLLRCDHLVYSLFRFQCGRYQLPEIVRTPLEQLCLQVRALKLARQGVGGVAEFVAKALTPPSDLALENALGRLIAVGALRADDEGLTPLGQHLVSLPMVSFRSFHQCAVATCVTPSLLPCRPCILMMIPHESGPSYRKSSCVRRFVWLLRAGAHRDLVSKPSKSICDPL